MLVQSLVVRMLDYDCVIEFYIAQTLALAFSGVAGAAVTNISERKANVVAFTSVGSVGRIQITTGDDTRIYHQNPDGSIWQVAVSGVFFQGQFEGQNMIVPAGEALYGTPIAVTVSGAYADIHLFLLSPTLIFSEYMYTPALGKFIGASACRPQCITTNGFFKGFHITVSLRHGKYGGWKSCNAPSRVQ
ncbi:hypothetical protein C8J56DRAFT_1062053 [Mycena floridula]|nr:hypothetical protein C8J56DRAFT_1062053 [Mycena floridula]